jgi:kynurenine formamidase
MARRLIDISVPLQNDVPADPPGLHPTIQYSDHQQSLPRMLQFFDGLKAEDLPDGHGWAMEMVQLSTHNGTHLDARGRGPSTKCRWNGACSPASSWTFAIWPTVTW